MALSLAMFKSDGQRKDFPFSKPRVVIGRGENCDLQVPLASVSRRHCALEIADDAVKVKDLGSSNGTYVNSERVTESELAPGDRLAVGPIVFTVQINGQPEEIEPVLPSGRQEGEAGAADGDEIVDLDADVVSNFAADDEDEFELDESALDEEATEEIDPLAALEALADEDEEEEQK